MIINNVNVNELKFNNLDVEVLKYNGNVVWQKSTYEFDWSGSECEFMENNYPQFLQADGIFIKKGPWLSETDFIINIYIADYHTGGYVGDPIIYQKYNQVGNNLYKIGDPITLPSTSNKQQIVMNNDCNYIQFIQLGPCDDVSCTFDDNVFIQYINEYECWIFGDSSHFERNAGNGVFTSYGILTTRSFITNTRYLYNSSNQACYIYPARTNFRYFNCTSGVFSLIHVDGIFSAFGELNRYYNYYGIKTYWLVHSKEVREQLENNMLWNKPDKWNVEILTAKTQPDWVQN